MTTQDECMAEAEAEYQADKAAMALLELPREVQAWLKGMWDEAEALKSNYE